MPQSKEDAAYEFWKGVAGGAGLKLNTNYGQQFYIHDHGGQSEVYQALKTNDERAAFHIKFAKLRLASKFVKKVARTRHATTPS